MLRKVIKTTEFDVLYEQYESTHELVKTLSERPLNSAYEGSTPVQKELRESWHGVSKMSEAHDMLYYGWNKEIEKFKTQIKINSASLQYKPKQRLVADYVGAAPIVANAIMGIPKAMVGTNYKPKRHKILHLLIDCGVSSMYSPSEILEWGSKIVATINRLEQEGYRCKVEVMYNFGLRSGRTQQVLRFKVKDEGHPIDLQRFTFPMAHPAMFRAVGFNWEETLPGGKALGGKGQPLNTYNDDDRNKILKVLTDKDGLVIYANIRTDLQQVLKDKIGWSNGKEVVK